MHMKSGTVFLWVFFVAFEYRYKGLDSWSYKTKHNQKERSLLNTDHKQGGETINTALMENQAATMGEWEM